MAYNNVPQSSQRISDTQPLIQSNFQQIQTALSVNHVPIADASGNQGKHLFAEFPVVAMPAGITGATEVGIYAKNSAFGTTPPALWMQKAGLGPNAGFEFTNYESTFVPNNSNAFGNGWVQLAAGILIKWFNTTTNASPVILNGAGLGPNFSQVASVQLTSSSTTAIVSYTTYFNTPPGPRITIQSSAGNVGVTVLVIGIQ